MCIRDSLHTEWLQARITKLAFGIEFTLHNVKEAVELAQTNYVSVKSTIDPETAGSNYDNKGAQGAGSIALGESCLLYTSRCV